MKSLLFTFFVLFNCILYAQTLDPYKFFPSAVGNVWEYSYSNGNFSKTIISDTTLQDGSKLIYYNTLIDPAFRIDTSFNCFYDPIQLNWRYYELDADSGAHWMVRAETSEIQRMEAQVRAKYPAIFFGRQTTIMEITYYDLNWGDTVINQFSWPRFTMTLGYGIGEIMEFDEEGGGPQRILQGCIIEGDTIGIITSVEDEFNELNTFELYQNYPNPFNSTTIIPYEISKSSFVSINVYDVLGNEIVQLLNETKTPGKYQVPFDVDNYNKNLSTGVYFYKIFLDQKQKTKKMIYLK